jgi:RHS repeat-associated protein
MVLEERDSNEHPLVSYTRGRDLSGSLQGAGGIGGLLARTDHGLLAVGDPNAQAFYHADGNGNVTCLINMSQAIVANYHYDPFGNVVAQSGSLACSNLYRFSSKEFHAASGLVYYLYRYYDPNLQRWVNRDPLGDGGSLVYAANHLNPNADEEVPGVHVEEIEGANPYGFVSNDPDAAWDAFGTSKGGKQNISCEGFTKASCPDDVKAAADAAKAAKKLKSYRKLMGLWKVIKRGGTLMEFFVWFWVETSIEEFVQPCQGVEA